ncbi:hypothetical protein FOZ63_006110 [Perkinsus olseni]|uniref:Uncharacterized protein n=1 Tax=Perkinsus olseni TaxID=32597 RepID=A0A7J6TKS6_PEROL|nr:hypothetical protein FOZ63_006110 [Perkinsus olseni]
MVKLVALFGLPHVTTALPYPMTEGSYGYGGAPLTGCSITFGEEVLQFTCPGGLSFPGLMNTRWRYVANPDNMGYYHKVIVWDEEYQKEWPKDHKLKLKSDGLEVVLDTDRASYSFQWSNSSAPGQVSVNSHEGW